MICRMLQLLVTGFALSSTVAIAQMPQPAVEKMQDLYLKRLDAWVAAGGDVNKIQSDVLESCGRMMYLRDPSLGTATSKELKDSLDMRIDVCAKITVHRAHPQPEFSKPEIVRIVCQDMVKNEPVIARLCEKAGLKV
jgi:hypothetical protein